MKVFGFESIESQLEDESFQFKLLINDNGVVFFPTTTEHRDATVEGIRYQDDYGGNALAAMVKSGQIEIRFHRAFSDERVRSLMQSALSLPEMTFAKPFRVLYQARTLIESAD